MTVLSMAWRQTNPRHLHHHTPEYQLETGLRGTATALPNCSTRSAVYTERKGGSGGMHWIWCFGVNETYRV